MEIQWIRMIVNEVVEIIQYNDMVVFSGFILVGLLKVLFIVIVCRVNEQYEVKKLY